MNQRSYNYNNDAVKDNVRHNVHLTLT